jgi:hypothetical protein
MNLDNRGRCLRCSLLSGAVAALLLTGVTASACAQFGGFEGMRPALATGLFG